MSKIPTAERVLREILGDCGVEYHELKESCPEIIKGCLDMIRSQNKLYVEAALKAASENADTLKGEVYASKGCIDKESILNAYPLNNIK
jgi:hypothetical protein